MEMVVFNLLKRRKQFQVWPERRQSLNQRTKCSAAGIEHAKLTVRVIPAIAEGAICGGVVPIGPSPNVGTTRNAMHGAIRLYQCRLGSHP